MEFHFCSSLEMLAAINKNQEFPPQSVIILGHSMGGLIARALLTLKNFKPELINLIITQATPHVMPVLSLDHYLIDFYAMVNEYWTLNAKDLQNVTVLSVAGGFRDFQVRSGLTFLPVSSIHTSALSVVSTAVPRTWASTDHLSIVWCKELILATSRALFDLIDEQTRQITDDPEKRLSVLKHHFIRHPAKLYEDSYETVLSISESSTWLPIVTTSWKYLATGVCNETYFEFPLQDKRHRYSHFHCRSTFLYTHSWIFGCEKKSVKCLKIEDLSWKAELLPTAKIITLKLDEFHNISHLVIYLPPTNNTKFAVECEFLKEESITQELPVTHALSFGFSSNRININSSGLLHVLQLHGFSKIYQAFDLLIEKDCKQSTENVPNMFRFHVPWSNADIIRTSSNDAPLYLPVKLHEPQPQNHNRTASLTLYTSPDCNYEVTISTSFLQMLGQIIRFHGPSLPVYIMSNLLLAYGAQLYSLSRKGHCLEFDALLDTAAKPYKVDPIVNICRFLLGYDWFKNSWDSLFLPNMDSSELYALGLLFPLASLLLFMFGTGVAYWSGILFKGITGFFAATWKAMNRTTPLSDEHFTFTKRVFLEMLLACLVCWRTCGAFCIVLIFVRYFLKVVKLQSDLWSYLSKNKILNQTSDSKPANIASKESPSTPAVSEHSAPSTQQESSDHSHFDSHFTTASENLKMHITIMNLLLWLMMLIFPSFVYWAKNHRYNIQLDPDPNRMLAILLVLPLMVLMNTNVVSMKSSKLLKTTARLQLPFSILVVAFGTLHLYRVPYFIALSILLHAMACFL
ncbi:GPI inositol-deacylase isoform X3 [Hyperolius riggenbachi]|uniref:GPI inositol-deacylase isoform X3 n=1 Tax=Hyperolius riggenbachi TaxID=752182 RepID=UPI0035A2FA9C